MKSLSGGVRLVSSTGYILKMCLYLLLIILFFNNSLKQNVAFLFCKLFIKIGHVTLMFLKENIDTKLI